jgi:hypothetical protein
MPVAWSVKDERQYKHILSSCKRTDRRRSLRTCKRIAAATVNKQRRREGRTLGETTISEKLMEPRFFLPISIAIGSALYILTSRAR